MGEKTSNVKDLVSVEDGESNMIRLVSQTVQREREKGVAVVKQTEIYSKLIELRLLLFDAQYFSNELPSGELYRKLVDEGSEKINLEVDSACEEINLLLSLLLDLKYDLSFLNEKLSSDLVGKNASNSNQNRVDSSISERLNDIEASQEPWIAECIRQAWEESIISRLGSSALGLTSIRGNTYTIIEQTLKSDMKQLIEMSKVPKNKDEFAYVSQGDTKLSETDTYPDTFDDTSSYNQLARTLLELQKYTSSIPGSIDIVDLSRKLNKKSKRKNVDSRINKQKKIKFQVHEKISNFMAPRQRARSHLDAETANNVFSALFAS